jgi:anti-sigma-K factor RskA
MTEPRDNTDINEEMDPRFENLAAYALNALDTDDERREVESLVDSDNEALAELNELSESAGFLAIAVPPATPPDHLKERILRLVAEESRPATPRIAPTPISSLPWWQRMFQSGYAVSAAAAVLVIVVGGVLGYQNNQLSGEIDSLRSDLAAESVAVANLQTELSTTMTDSETKVALMKSDMEVMEDEFGAANEMLVHQEEMVSELAVANDALREALRDQSWLTYVAMKEGYQVASWLGGNAQQVSATQTEPAASGLIAVRVVGNEAVFQVHGLPQPQADYAYTLWLMGYGNPTPVAQFNVSEIGSATIAFLLPNPLQFYTSVVVTQERVDGIGNDPTGTMVLSAETN